MPKIYPDGNYLVTEDGGVFLHPKNKSVFRESNLAFHIFDKNRVGSSRVILKADAATWDDQSDAAYSEATLRIMLLESTLNPKGVFGFGNGLVFNGTDTFVNGVNVALTPLSNGISFWARFDETFGAILADGSGTLNNILLLNNATNIRYYTALGMQRNLNPQIVVGEKDHYLFSQDATTISLYKNGVLIDSDTSTGIDMLDTIGAGATPSLFLGMQITELAICNNYTPTEEDALDLYNDGNGAIATDILTNVLRYYRTNEVNGASELVDETENQNGTLNNFSGSYFTPW